MKADNDLGRDAIRSFTTRWTAEGIAKGYFNAFDDLVTRDVIDHAGLVDQVGSAGFKERARAVYSCFSNIAIDVDDVVIDSSLFRIAWRWTLSGTHAAPFMGIAPTGNRVAICGMNIQRLTVSEDGGLRVVEHWSIVDSRFR